MAKKFCTVKKFRAQRRLATDLPGLGKQGALERRPYAPGQHGARRRKPSEYGIRLLEKQKLLSHYSLRERSIRRFVRDSHRAGVNWISEFSRRLELRLDNLVFRFQFAPSMKAARQLVRHGHIQVNGVRKSVGSMVLKIGDEVRVAEGSKEMPMIIQGSTSPRLDLPSFLEKTEPLCGKVINNPTTADIPFQYNERLIAEWYAVRG